MLIASPSQKRFDHPSFVRDNTLDLGRSQDRPPKEFRNDGRELAHRAELLAAGRGRGSSAARQQAREHVLGALQVLGHDSGCAHRVALADRGEQAPMLGVR